MKRTCRPRTALPFPLVLTLLCQLSSAHPLHRESPSSADTVTLHAADSLAVAADRVQNSPVDSTSSASGASLSPEVHYFYEPFPMPTGTSILQVGASFSLLPYPDAEQELPIPALDVQYKRGIFRNVSVVGSLSTCYYSNLIHAGIQYNTRLDRFSCGLANHVGFVYGFITRENVFDDVHAHALFDMVIMRLGYRFDEFSFSCSIVVTYVMSSQSYVGGLAASVGPQHTLNDYYCTLVVEQPFLKSLQLSIGLSLGYARTPYQTWMLYNTLDEWLFVPEFFFAVQL